MLIGILITAFGVLGGVVTIFCVFVPVENPIEVTKKGYGIYNSLVSIGDSRNYKLILYTYNQKQR